MFEIFFGDSFHPSVDCDGHEFQIIQGDVILIQGLENLNANWIRHLEAIKHNPFEDAQISSGSDRGQGRFVDTDP